jgi:hypothetical protein
LDNDQRANSQGMINALLSRLFYLLKIIFHYSLIDELLPRCLFRVHRNFCKPNCHLDNKGMEGYLSVLACGGSV